MEQPETQPSQADLLAARREARRKRILDNTNNRLTKITGREHNEAPAENPTKADPVEVYPDPDFERIVYERPTHSNHPMDHLADAGELPNGDIFQLLQTLTQVQANGAGGLPSGGVFPSQDSRRHTSAVPTSRFMKILQSKVHLVLAAVVIYLLFATGHQQFVGSNVFLPLLTWELLEAFILKTYEPTSSMLDVVFLLAGISKRHSQFIVKLAQTVSKILKDVAFFVFFFVLSHLLWSWLVLGQEMEQILGYRAILEAHGSVPS